MFKRCISLLLVLVTLVSFLPAPARAAEVATEGTQVDFEATNDFGTLLTNSLEDSDQAQTASDANRVCDLQIEDGYAWVEFATTEEARVVVAIYTEDGTKMLGSGTETVSPSETEVGIQIEIDNMPQYYSAGAYLLSAADNTPLSKEFRTQLYTKPVQDIKNSTVDDYDPERVLNLDEDPTTNFAVFGKNTILLDSSVVVTISGNTYTIENASDALKAMQPGDSFAQMRKNEEVLIVKAAKVKVTGDTVIVTDDPDADLSDVFEVVKIEGQSDKDNTTYDDSTLDPSLEIVTEDELYAITGERSRQRDEEITGKVEIPIKAKDNDYYSLGAYLIPNIDVTFYFRPSYQYVSWTVSVSVTGRLEIKKEPKEEDKFRLPLGYFNIYLTCGCRIYLDPFVFFEPSGKVTTTIDLNIVYKKTYDSDLKAWEGSPDIDLDVGVEAEGTLYFGVGFEIGIHFLTEKLAALDVTLKIGPELSIKKAVPDQSTDISSQVHTCKLCFDGSVNTKYSMALKFTLFGKETVLLDSLPDSELTLNRDKFYFCVDNLSFGMGTCPNIFYRVDLKMQDPTGVPLPEVSVKLFDASGNQVTEAIQVREHKPFMGAIPNSSDEGVVRIYLTNGKYTAECTTPEETKKVSFTVYKASKSIPVILTSATATEYLSLDKTSIDISTRVGQQLKATFGPSTLRQDVTNACTWQSSDESVVKIKNGTLTPLAEGTANITVSYTKDGSVYQDTCKVRVWEKYGLILSHEEVSIAIGSPPVEVTAKFGFGLDTEPNIATDCQWTSSDAEIATVDGGLISAQALGTATITATYTSDGEVYTAECEVTVEPRPIVASGSCGDSLTWTLDDLGELVISGTGDMYCYNSWGDKSPWYSKHITSVVISAGVTSIGDYSFYNCYNMTRVTIPDGVTFIGDSAFYGCFSLTSITIPASVNNIDRRIFAYCDALTDITVASGNPVYHSDGNCIIQTASKALVSGCSTTVLPADGSVTSINDCAFYYIRTLASIDIPDTITEIGTSAFQGCSGLTSVVIPDGVTAIEANTFYDCTGLTRVTIPVSVTEISYYAFVCGSRLKDVYYGGTTAQWKKVSKNLNSNTSLRTATIHCSDGIASQALTEDVPVVVAETEPLEATIPEVTQAVTEPVVVETQPETTVETTEPTEETTGATEETTMEAEALSDRNWRILPSGAEMRTGAAVNLAAFTGKETTKNGLRTVAFTGLEPGEEYVLIVSLVPGSVASNDLMYIDQATADDTGALTLSYIPRQDVAAIVQLYGIPTDRGITLDREYVTMKAGAAPELLAATVTPAQWASTLVWASSDETVLAMGTDGSLTPLAPGTAYAIATVTHGKYTLSARCRVDVTEEVSNVAVTAVVLGTDRVTTQLYSKDYVNFDVLLLLEQNLPQVTTFAQEETPRDNGVAITGARFADEAVRSLFALQVKDDRTLTLIPTQAAIDAGKTVKSSYSSPVIVTVNGVEFSTGSALTVSVQKSTPKLTAKALSFNSFYSGQTQAISITGGSPTAITGDLPDWLKLENGKLTLTAANVKASETLRLSVETEEWAVPATVTVKVSASPNAPSLKLSKTSLTFSNTCSTGISLTLKAGKQPLEALGVEEIRAGEGFAVTDLNLDTGTFTLTPTGRVSAGKTALTVSFYGTDATLTLPLKVSTKAPTLKFSKSSVKLNAATGDSITLKLTANPGDLDLTQVQLSDPSGALAATAVDADGCFTLSTTADTQVKKTYTLVATAPGGKTAKLKVSTMASTPAMTAKASGKIDLTYPQVGLSITPTLKNYSGSLENIHHSLEIKQGSQWEPGEFSQYFTLGADGKLYQAPGFSLVSGTQCRITLHGQLPDGTALSAPVSVKVTQTAIPLKLSKSTLSLNKSLNEWATVAVTTSVKGYTLGTPEMPLTDSKGAPSQALDLRYQEGLLRIAVNDATAYGQSYQLRLWVTPNKVSILRVKIPSQSASAVTISAKAKGTIDVIRDNSAILITPTYRNWAGETPLETQVAITQASDRKHYTQDVSGSFLWQWLENGQLKVQKKPGATLEPGWKYRLELSVAGGKTATVALRIQSGSAKASVQPVTLYAEDAASQGQLRFTLTDTTLNPLERVQIKGSKHQAQFQVLPWGAGQFALAQIPGAQAKSAKVTLELFFRGNTTNKPNATVTLPVTIR